MLGCVLDKLIPRRALEWTEPTERAPDTDVVEVLSPYAGAADEEAFARWRKRI
jgi:hypothetical protein